MLSFLDVINLVGSLASLILAVISIWLALYFYRESKNSEKESSNLLTKTEQQVALMQKVTSRMLERYVNYSTLPKEADQVTLKLMELLDSSKPPAHGGFTTASSSSNNRQVNIDRTTAYIATMYWSGIANLASQNDLPPDIMQLEDDEYSGLKNIIDMSKNDFSVAKDWLDKNGHDFIEESTAKSYYDYLVKGELDDLVRDTYHAYVAKSASTQQN